MNQSSSQAALAHRPGIAVVSAQWHRDIVSQALTAIDGVLAAAGYEPARIVHATVPGAFEIPLQAQRMARSGQFEAVIACALVVNGGIYRHEFVASAVIDGLMRVQLDTDVPVFSAVLTPRDFHEHVEHRRFFTEHFITKGREVAQACLATIATLRQWPPAAQGHAQRPA